MAWGNYFLEVKLKSNETSFTGGTEDLGQNENDEEAKEWAARMQETLGGRYDCILYRREKGGKLGERIEFEALNTGF